MEAYKAVRKTAPSTELRVIGAAGYAFGKQVKSEPTEKWYGLSPLEY